MPKWKGNVSHAVQLYVQVYNRLVPWLILLLWAPMHSLTIKVFLLSLSLKHLADCKQQKAVHGFMNKASACICLSQFHCESSTLLHPSNMSQIAISCLTSPYYCTLLLSSLSHPCVHTYTWNTLDTNTQWHPVTSSEEAKRWLSLLVSHPDTVV